MNKWKVDESIVQKWIGYLLKKAKWTEDEEKINTFLKMRSKLKELL